MKKFVALFPIAKSVHVTKEIGLIPYYMHVKYGYEPSIACYGRQNEFPTIDQTPGLSIWTIERSKTVNVIEKLFYRFVLGSNYMDYLYVAEFIKKNAMTIDVLQVYHVHDEFVGLLSRLYKKYNKKGVLCLKLDLGENTYRACLERYNERGFKHIRYRIRLHLLRQYIDIVSVESRKFITGIREIFDKEPLYLPNGCYELKSVTINEHRENLFLTVANLSEWKGSDLLVEAFAMIYEKCNWNLVLVGPCENNVLRRIKDIFKDHPKLERRIIMTGNIVGKRELYEYYKRAGVFILPSKGEAFPTVVMEAMYNGCFLVITETVAPKDDIVVDGDEGVIIPPNDKQKLAEVMLRIARGDYSNIINNGKNKIKYQNRFSYNHSLVRLQEQILNVAVKYK
ncbi:MAG: glycosyltransferase family 4 protein [Lachnospiraceae bacterium]|nr:glycosyltransferase family 4 protein [Lachnospiraceae bacterium]